MELIIKITTNDPVDRRVLNNILAASHSEIHAFIMDIPTNGYLVNRKEYGRAYELDIQINDQK